MTSFIDSHRSVLWVEPICRVLPIAPPTYYGVISKFHGRRPSVDPSPTRHCHEGRGTPGFRPELPRLRRARGLAIVAVGRLYDIEQIDTAISRIKIATFRTESAITTLNGEP